MIIHLYSTENPRWPLPLLNYILKTSVGGASSFESTILISLCMGTRSNVKDFQAWESNMMGNIHFSINPHNSQAVAFWFFLQSSHCFSTKVSSSGLPSAR